MITGISMDQETCQILGQVSHNICGPGGDGQGDGVPKAGVQQAAADSQGSRTCDSQGSRTCVCANTQPGPGGTHAGSRWARKSRSGLMKSSILKTHEHCEGSISLTRRMRSSKKPSRTRVRSWEHQSLLLCPVKL